MNHTHRSAGVAEIEPVLWLLFVIVPLVVWAAYLVAALRARGTGAGFGAANGTWSLWRIASFTAGTALLIVAMVPPVATWAHHDLRGHMAQHLLLGMFAPLGLVFGAPGTLLLRSLPVAGARRFTRLLGTWPIRFLIHPVTACVLNIGAMALLYLTPLFALSMSHAGVHVWVHVHFVVAGYVFTWAIAGPDPAPKRPGFVTRLAVLLVGAGAHASLAKWMYAHGFPAGTLRDLEEIRAAAKWMYYGGDIAELLLIVAFFTVWFRRRSAAHDRARQAEAQGSALRREKVVTYAPHGPGWRNW